MCCSFHIAANEETRFLRCYLRQHLHSHAHIHNSGHSAHLEESITLTVALNFQRSCYKSHGSCRTKQDSSQISLQGHVNYSCIKPVRIIFNAQTSGTERLLNIISTLIQRHGVESALLQYWVNFVCLQGMLWDLVVLYWLATSGGRLL